MDVLHEMLVHILMIAVMNLTRVSSVFFSLGLRVNDENPDRAPNLHSL